PSNRKSSAIAGQLKPQHDVLIKSQFLDVKSSTARRVVAGCTVLKLFLSGPPQIKANLLRACYTNVLLRLKVMTCPASRGDRVSSGSACDARGDASTDRRPQSTGRKPCRNHQEVQIST